MREVSANIRRFFAGNVYTVIRVHLNVICNENVSELGLICDKHWRETIQLTQSLYKQDNAYVPDVAMYVYLR